MALSSNKLFSPVKINQLELPNRLAMAPMTMQLSPGGIPSDAIHQHYVSRAAGGIGLIITEGTPVNHPVAAGMSDVSLFYGEKASQAWKKIVADVHSYGAKIFPQLWHAGASRLPGTEPNADHDIVSPSGLFLPDKAVGRAMTTQDIDAVIKAYAEGAQLAEQLGFDGVEIHGAHGYLLHQFMWPGTNKRTDNYGGSLENRIRLAVEVLQAMRGSVSADFPICMRFSQWGQQYYQATLADTPQELEKIIIPMADAGADLFHASTRRFWVPEFEGSELNLAGWIKKISGKPVITVGSVGLDKPIFEVNNEQQEVVTEAKPAKLDTLLEKLEADEFDLVALGRILLTNPDWAHKVKAHRWQDIAPYQRPQLMDDYQKKRQSSNP